MRRFPFHGPWTALWFITLLLTDPGPSLGSVELHISRIGFPTVRTGTVIRSGAYIPIVVDLALIEQSSFDGTLRTAQFDTDGDECYDSVEVHLRVETGGAQRFTLYALANPVRARGRFSVELLDLKEEAVQVVSQGILTFRAVSPAQRQPLAIGSDDILILSVSSGTIGHVRELADPDRVIQFERPVHVAHLSPADLPELWIGLEIVDYIVWDNARPDELSQRQRDALITWVRFGGTLLIAASRSAGSVKLAQGLQSVLPVDLGEVTVVDNLPQVRRELTGPPTPIEGDRLGGEPEEDRWFEEPFPEPIPIVQTSLRRGAVRLIEDSDVVTQRRLGRGNIVFCAVTLRDLFSAEGSASDFFRTVFHLSVVESADLGRPRAYSLFGHVVSAVAFSTSAGLYLLSAFAFSILYVVIATGGVWWFLGKRGWRQHSWSAFTLVAAGASVMSVVVVHAMRGFGDTLHQLSIVDLEAGDRYGYATTFFGLKTGSDRELDLWLPADPRSATEPIATSCFLRPLPAGQDPSAAMSSFADPESYRLMPASAVVDGVRLRATLKRFEGRWEGPLGGTLTAQVTLENHWMTQDSYIVNDLGVDLRDCVLLQTTVNIDKDSKGTRSSGIYALPVGDLPGDGSRVDLVPRCYRLDVNETPPQFLNRHTLLRAQIDWSAPFQSFMSRFKNVAPESASNLALGEQEKALLLLSTIGEFDWTSMGKGLAKVLGATTWSRDRLRRLDLREQLRDDTLILIGFADDPGPVRLFGRTGDKPFRPIKPDRRNSWTMYRIRIPVTIVGGSDPLRGLPTQNGSPTQGGEPRGAP